MLLKPLVLDWKRGNNEWNKFKAVCIFPRIDFRRQQHHQISMKNSTCSNLPAHQWYTRTCIYLWFAWEMTTVTGFSSLWHRCDIPCGAMRCYLSAGSFLWPQLAALFSSFHVCARCCGESGSYSPSKCRKKHRKAIPSQVWGLFGLFSGLRSNASSIQFDSNRIQVFCYHQWSMRVIHRLNHQLTSSRKSIPCLNINDWIIKQCCNSLDKRPH